MDKIDKMIWRCVIIHLMYTFNDIIYILLYSHICPKCNVVFMEWLCSCFRSSYEGRQRFGSSRSLQMTMTSQWKVSKAVEMYWRNVWGSEIFPKWPGKTCAGECFERLRKIRSAQGSCVTAFVATLALYSSWRSIPARPKRCSIKVRECHTILWLGVGDVLMCFHRTWKMTLLMAEIPYLIGSFSHCLQGFNIASGAGFFSFHHSCSMWVIWQSWIDVSGWKVGRLGKYLPNTDVFQAKRATKCVIILFLDTRVLCMFLEVKRCTTPWVRCRAGVSCKVKGKPPWSCSLPISVRSIRRMPSLLPQL